MYTFTTFLTPSGIRKIEQEIENAEKVTSGEIKVLVTQRSRFTLWYRIMLLWYLGLSAFKYLHMPRKTRRQKAELRALVEYFRLGVHKTREATGVLIQICLDARWVTVVADKSINDLVESETWSRPRDAILEGIRSGNQTEGICAAIIQIREVLAPCFPVWSDDVNEINNRVEFRR